MTTKLSATSSKADEIKALENFLRNTLVSGCYLSDLFSVDMMNWVTNQIENDAPPDLFDYFTKAEAETDAARAEVAKITDSLNHACAERDSARDAAEALCEQLTAERAKNERLTEENYRLAAEVLDCSQDADAVQRDLRDQITKLKAKLYDLEHAND